MTTKKSTLIICAAILGLGFLGAGYSISKGMSYVKLMSRTVTVKGIAERSVKSDLGIWEINYREIGADLIQLDQRLQHDQEVVVAFLKDQGFEDAEISRANLKVEDRLANVYGQEATQADTQRRYIVTTGIRVRSTKVDLIQKSVVATEKLLQQGVTLAFDVSSLSPNPSYYYTGLDAIRPGMMADATKSARIVAEQFAKDADCDLAGIQRASQGVFQIMSSDTSTMSADWSSNESALGSINKKVRLVTTLDYRLR